MLVPKFSDSVYRREATCQVQSTMTAGVGTACRDKVEGPFSSTNNVGLVLLRQLDQLLLNTTICDVRRYPIDLKSPQCDSSCRVHEFLLLYGTDRLMQETQKKSSLSKTLNMEQFMRTTNDERPTVKKRQPKNYKIIVNKYNTAGINDYFELYQRNPLCGSSSSVTALPFSSRKFPRSNGIKYTALSLRPRRSVTKCSKFRSSFSSVIPRIINIFSTVLHQRMHPQRAQLYRYLNNLYSLMSAIICLDDMPCHWHF